MGSTEGATGGASAVSEGTTAGTADSSGRSERARLEQLATAVAEIAAAQADLQRQLDDLVTTVERLSAPDPETGGDAPARRDGPSRPGAEAAGSTGSTGKRLLRPAARLARAGLRATLGTARRVWDAAHPDPPWRDRVRLRVGAPAEALPTVGPAGAEYRWSHPAASRADELELLRIALAADRPAFLRLEGGTLVVEAALWHPENGIDLEALAQRARAEDAGVLGRDIALGSEIDPGGDDLLIADPRARAALRRVDGWWLPAREQPRVWEHEIHPLPSSEPGGDGESADASNDGDGDGDDGHPRVLAVVDAPLLGGRERLLADALEAIGGDRTLLAARADQAGLAARRWRALASRVGARYPLAGALPPPLRDPALAYLLRRHRIDRLFWLGPAAGLAGALPALRRARPALRIAAWLEDELGAPSSAPIDGVTVCAGAGEGLARALRDAGVAGIARRDLAAARSAPQPAAGGEALRAALGLDDGDVLAVAVCDLIAEERPEDFVLLADRLRDQERLCFLLVGDGPLADGVEDLRRLLAPPRLLRAPAGTVRAAAIDAADLVCLLAERPDVDGRVRDALAAGKPVLASAVGDLPTRLGEGPSGLALPVGDLDAWEAALRRLLAPEARRALTPAVP